MVLPMSVRTIGVAMGSLTDFVLPKRLPPLTELPTMGAYEAPRGPAPAIVLADEVVVMSQRGEPSQDRRRLGGGAIASFSGLAVLAIFVIQNTQEVRFHFLFLDFTWPLWLYTIVVALFGAFVWFGLGVLRRHRRRKARRAARRA